MSATGEIAGPGWYPSPDGHGQRWWDGRRWTDHRVSATRVQTLADARSPGQRLRDALATGRRPQPHPPMIPVSSMEEVYAVANVEIFQLGGSDPDGVVGAPSPNEVPGWHPVEHGTVHMTSFRFACKLSRQFVNVPYVSIADAYCDEDGLCVWQHGRAPVKIRVVDPEWHFVLFRWLAYGEPAVAR